MARTKRCDCGEDVVWTQTKGGKWMLVDASSYDDDDPGLIRDHKGIPIYDPDLGHVAHWGTCPNAEKHRP